MYNLLLDSFNTGLTAQRLRFPAKVSLVSRAEQLHIASRSLNCVLVSRMAEKSITDCIYFAHLSL